MKQILLIFLFTLASATLFSKEIHVSPKGDNLSEGSLSKPLKSIQAAANMALPGDVVIVHAGVYREQVIPPRGGDSESKPIVYQAAKGEKVVIKGSEVVTGWKKLENSTWKVEIPNTFFGNFNPYSDLIRGDWFNPQNRLHHTGAVYLNGSWLMEAATKELVMAVTDEKNPLWWADVDSVTTTILAQFFNKDPNAENVEINVRQTIFYPDKPFVNFITIRGFTMEHAATNWAPPTAEQKGLIGTHWSRGWVIENNIISYSKCVGIALGKYGDTYDNTSAEAAEGYVGTINRALAFGWNKATVGGHIVRNNTIAYCEQAGIVGSMGCSFSIIEGNTIHDVHVRKLFNGAEMAGIKFHGAIDVMIRKNRIYHTCLGVWLDWMAQGAQVNDNLFYENDYDLFLEMDHGPMLIANNLMLSDNNLMINAKGAAFAHNLFAGKSVVIVYDSRQTPYHKPHSTSIEKLATNEGGDMKFISNIFGHKADFSDFGKSFLPVLFDGNVFTKGAVRPDADKMQNRFGEFNEEGKKQFAALKTVNVVEKNSISVPDFDLSLKLFGEADNISLELNLDKKWVSGIKRTMVTTSSLGKAIIPGLPFENPDGSAIKTDKDYLGKTRAPNNPSPGPFEITQSGLTKLKIW